MRKILITMVACIVSFNAFCASYNCKFQDKQDTGFLGIGEKGWWGNDTVGYLYCGHVGTDGCKDGAVVVVNNDSLQRCDNHVWRTVLNHKIDDCSVGTHAATAMERIGYKYYISGDDVIFYNPKADTEEITEYCRMWLGYLEEYCTKSGGKWESTVCDCSGNETLQREGDAPFSQCECKDGFKRGDDKKCWPEEYVDGKCLKDDDRIYCPKTQGAFNGVSFSSITENKDCYYYKDDEQFYRICNDNGKIVKKTGVACPGFSDELAWEAWWSSRGEYDIDSEGFECYKSKTQYNYKSCSSDSDCTGIDNTKRPYLHSTAWHCAWQSAGVRVCTATACESGWTPINGYCQEDKTPASSNQPKPADDNSGQTNKPKTSTTTVTQKKTCTDPNMDSNCRCTVVAETVERGGKCVCVDDDREIKDGKCEYTAAYIAKMESELDMKYASLNATIGGLEKSVWRDEEGNFNTARLASDSIAGVVLGTVGGIVTSNLVKKAQVKQGFEDIGCYIGGQSVAGYGDEFTVGR